MTRTVRSPLAARIAHSLCVPLTVLGAAMAGPLTAQALVDTELTRGRLLLDRVKGSGLTATKTGEAAERTVAIYLPPSYQSRSNARFPVLTLLHGIGGTHQDWTGPRPGAGPWQTMQDVMDRGIAAGRIAEMIIVAPDQRTRGGGSFYVNSTATGSWEDFTATDLVAHVDANYRTLTEPESRGIAGHSMGGYGAIQLGMRHPDVFRVVYGMNSALLGWAGDVSETNLAFARAANATPQSLNPRRDLYVASFLCVAQAFSPNPEKPPFFADLPFESADGGLVKTAAHASWTQRMPLYTVEHHVAALRSLRGLRFDSGRYDAYTHIPPTNRALSERLTQLQIPHVFEEYNGGHNDRVWGEEGRLAADVLPWFSRLLARQ